MRIVRPVSDFYVAARLMPALFNGMAIAVSLMPVPVFIGLAGGIGPSWEGSTALAVGGALGLILGGLVLAPYLRMYGGYTIPDFLAERFGGDKVRPLAVVAVLLCSFPALAAALLALGLIASSVFPVTLPLGVGAGVAMIFLCTLIGGMRSLSLAQIAQYTVALIVALTGLGVVLWQTGSIFSAEVLLLDEVIPKIGIQAFAHHGAANRVGLIFCVAAGTAALPFLLMRSLTAISPAEARGSFLAALPFAGVLCLAAPAFAALFEAAWVGADDGLSMSAEALLAVGAVAALLASGSALALAIANALSYDFYYKTVQPRASTGRLLLVARLSVVLVAGLAALAAVAEPQAMLTATAAALSLAASAFLPALVLGVWWKRATSDAALAGMTAGLLVCLYYMLAPEIIPFAFYESSSFLSNATEAQASAYEAMQQGYYLAEGATKEAVLSDWEATTRRIANWWGVRWPFAGLFAVPIGFLVMIGVSLLTRAPSEDVQRFVEEMRAGAA
ncbi:MAG: sodium:solute symporter family transporter [Methyloceanibacter sp.]|uniref:sodium:solute symporter family transporter n=1 Tax=Methyloceanibacter sp. TaxID=1965321 RepID=UPI003D6D2A40